MPKADFSLASVDKVRAELESLTFETPQVQPTPAAEAVCSDLEQIFGLTAAPSANKADDLRKTFSQNYQSDTLHQVMNRASDVSASTQETANNAKAA